MTMDESAIKGLKSLKVNDGGAESRKLLSTRTTISVEGYDTSLDKYPLKLALEKHFSSCGKILSSYVPKDFERGILKSVAFMRIEGEDAEDKALALSGTDVGGWTAIVKAAPMPDPRFAARGPNQEQPTMICVTGYDTSLPKIDIKMALCQHFSSCGEVTNVTPLPRGTAVVNLIGERCVDKAINLISGRNLGGMTLVVEPPANRPKKRRTSTTGYTPPSVLLEAIKEMEMEIKMEMDMEKKMEIEKVKKMAMETLMQREMEKEMKKDIKSGDIDGEEE